MIPFKAGIIAAGQGERLRHGKEALPKPLTPVAGKPLIDWTLEALWAAGAGEILCLINEESSAVSSYASHRWKGRPLRFIHKTTPSSYRSFRLVADALEADRFLISTVDGIYDPADLSRFVRFSSRSPFEVVLGLTDFVDDEKPLRASLDEATGRVLALGPRAEGSPHVTAGLYWCSRKAVNYHFSHHAQPSALREFLAELLSARVPMGGRVLGVVVDVDRPADIPAAERLLKEAGLVRS